MAKDTFIAEQNGLINGLLLGKDRKVERTMTEINQQRLLACWLSSKILTMSS